MGEESGAGAVMGKEQRPTAVAVEGSESEEGLVSGAAPELAGEFEPALILGAGGLDRA